MSVNRKNRLYCIFTRKDRLDRVVGLLKDGVEGKIFVLDIGKDRELAVTCNIEGQLPVELLNSTVLCHRHKETRTIYTINALNAIVKAETGTEDKNFQLDWLKYQDSLLVVQDGELIQFKTKLINII